MRSYSLILELYSEEIPAKMQKKAELTFQEIFTKNFKLANLSFNHLRVYIGPCRVVLHTEFNSIKLAAKTITHKGPQVGSTKSAIEGFCKAKSISSQNLTIKTFNNKQFYVYTDIIPSQHIKDLLPELILNSIKEYTWPKSMKWGNYKINWIRPLRNILCVFNNKELKISWHHLTSNNKSFGHKFISPSSFAINNWEDYTKNLRNNFVILDRLERKSIILSSLKEACKKLSVTLNYNDKLLDEVAGLVEYPVILHSTIPNQFLILPEEIITTSVQTHQKYFTTRDNNNKLSPHFLFVTNINPTDCSNIIEGNKKVLSSRLTDARYFFNQDCKFTLFSKVEKLKTIVFHTKIGSVFDKVQRIKQICNQLAPNDQELAIAAELCKSDLISEVVQEFPNLQGIIGKYYALNDNLGATIANIIGNHYSPINIDDEVPNGKAAILALADKIDSLTSLYLAGERATSSKDPFALRRYAFSIVRIILTNKIQIKLLDLLTFIYQLHNIYTNDLITEVLLFIIDKAKYLLKAKFNKLLVETIFEHNNYDNLTELESKINILDTFLASSKGQKFLQSYKRAFNIIKDKNTHQTKIDISKL
ncbi:glycine--tRNA ligase, beta subunit [Orientia chuto str. Dubai]|uniref:glycine--tRNA ligase n=1 Tax=Orientia chuto str. Dubai TaxID=1359168 RepID=A0A0F3MLA1_9RICK|nr:glycine--tRNA ligase subunit beta [Candidatus Orientia mediorientalis]KJV56525.1 glycine--tRNA ligase, beta subunit [Orientia chuto str. Dubai]